MTRHREFTALGRPILSIGGQARNSSAFTPDDAEYACRAVDALGGNTVAMPVSWELFEPREGEFDPSPVRDLIERVRRWGLHLVILWFASWKNGTMEYAPAWVKEDPARFPRVELPDGGRAFVLSQHSATNRDADARAFAALLGLVRDLDAEHGTVIAVQVENEPGIFAPVRRDFGPDGTRDFTSPVPERLIERARTFPESPLGAAWTAAGSALQGNWPEVFGGYGAEACSAWHLANYIDTVAAAGKEAYDLPLTVNTWVGMGTWGVAGLDYPSGGAVPTTGSLDIWRTAVEHIDMICPDMYEPNLDAYRDKLAAFGDDPGRWPLFIPETGNANPNAALMFHAVGERGAIGQHVFAIEDLVDEDGGVRPAGEPFARSFGMIRDVEPLIRRHRGTGAMHTLVQTPGTRVERLSLGPWRCVVIFGQPDFAWNAMDFRHGREVAEEAEARTDLGQEWGRAFIFQEGEDEFWFIGHRARVQLQAELSDDGSVPYALLSGEHQTAQTPTLCIEEGHFEAERFVRDRLRTGDEARHGIWLLADCRVVHVVMSSAGRR